VQSRTIRHEDGTVDIVQSGRADGAPTPETLQGIYWGELRAATHGFVRYSRGAVRIFGLWPALLRFGPLTGDARPIVGGIFARKPHGVIRWFAADGTVVVSVERFAPLLRGPFWRFESWLHDVVGRRYLARAGTREV
jgi:hypothetical protein